MEQRKELVKIYKKMIVATIGILVIIALWHLLSTVVGILYLSGVYPPAPSYEKVAKAFEKNKDDLIYIANWLPARDNQGVSLRKINGSSTMHIYHVETYRSEDITIYDEQAIACIERLYKSGFQVISKGSGGVSFSMWSSLDMGRGIKLSLNGEEPWSGPTVVLKPLSLPNWYYYEEDFDKWKEMKEATGEWY